MSLPKTRKNGWQPSLTKLLLIDPQNDFCDLPEGMLPKLGGVNSEPLRVAHSPALAVVGANDDMLRTAGFIRAVGASLHSITVTLDSHPFVAIERTTFWLDAYGKEVAPYTKITSASVIAGQFTPIHGERIEPISGLPLTQRVIELLQLLEAAGRYTLMVWPVHCVTGTWGANIHSAVASALAEWERTSAFPVDKVHKGQYPLVEHYGVFEAETPLSDVPSTRFNAVLANQLTYCVDLLFVAGQASSHCVAASVEQLLKFRRNRGEGIVLLTDCMSPVSGFEPDADAFFARAAAAGVGLMTSTEAQRLLTA